MTTILAAFVLMLAATTLAEDKAKEEELERIRRIEKARRLSKSWELMRLCKEYIQENSSRWMGREDEEEKERKREERRLKAGGKKEESRRKQEEKKKVQKITDLLAKIPVVEAQRIEIEVKRRERNELKEIKENIWKKWRGKSEVLKRKEKIPREIEILDKKLDEIVFIEMI